MKAGVKSAFLHPRVDFQIDFLAVMQLLKILAQRDLAFIPVILGEFMPGFSLLGADSFYHLKLVLQGIYKGFCEKKVLKMKLVCIVFFIIQ